MAWGRICSPWFRDYSGCVSTDEDRIVLFRQFAYCFKRMGAFSQLMATIAGCAGVILSSCQTDKIIAVETPPDTTTSSADDTTSDNSTDTIDTSSGSSVDTGSGSVAPTTDSVDTETSSVDTETSSVDTETDTGTPDNDTGTGTADNDTGTGPADTGTGTGMADTGTDTASKSCGDLDGFFFWTASPPLIHPPPGTFAIKDPTIVFYDNYWHLYATTRGENDWDMVYIGFKDWDLLDEAERVSVSRNPALTGYNVSPQLFYFREQEQWYLVYQTQEPAYSVSKTPWDVESWSPPERFMAFPQIVLDTRDESIDYWVICDDDTCYMFFSADNGRLYRAWTPRERFPQGFADPVDTTEIIMAEQDPFALYDACNVYKIAGTDQYLLLVSAIGSVRRYFRAWTATDLGGEWTPLADTESHSFASVNNVAGPYWEWPRDGINHGEMLRTDPDETMTIDPCDMTYLFQGLTAANGATYDDNEYSLGLLYDARYFP